MRDKKHKIYIMQGPPASGKSTLAKRLHKQNIEGSIIVSRDAIRESLGTYWVESREELVRNIEKAIILEAIKAEYDIIIDNTGMIEDENDEWEWHARFNDYEVEYRQCYLPKDECKIRNKCKDRRPVPDEFIDEFFEKWEHIMKDWDDYKSYHKYSDDEWNAMNYDDQISYELFGG